MTNHAKKLGGLQISFKHAKLIWTNKITSSPLSIRKISQIRDFMRDKNAATRLTNAYLMYRDIGFKKDKKLFKQNHLRYDITVIFPGLLGQEFNKTIGHYHQKGSKINYSEIYEVLRGQGTFLFQKIEKDKSRVKEIYLIKVKRGQNIIVPPGFAHITINTTNKPLILANIFADNVHSVYSSLRQRHGAGYYVIKRKNKIVFEKNPHYKSVAKLKICITKEVIGLKISFKKMLYDSFVQNPKHFEFLIKPEKYQNLLKPDKLFKIKS